MQNDQAVEILVEMRNWVRAAAFPYVRAALEAELTDSKSRVAYQMFDGTASIEQVRVACKMSPNSLIALANRCTARGLMEQTAEKKRVKLFDLKDFGLLGEEEQPSGAKK